MPICHSTNDVCLELSRQSHIFEGLVVWAGHQTAGRGQMGNTWVDEEGKNLLISILLKPTFLAAEKQFALNQVVSLAVGDLVSDYLPQGFTLKWPNDIYVFGKKMGGILIENSLSGNMLSQSVCGIGLNINQVDFALDTATSLAKLCSQTFDIQKIAESLLLHLEQRYLQLKRGEFGILKRDYHALLLGKDEWRYYEDNKGVFRGMILGVTEAGLLQLERPEGGCKNYNLKEIRFIL